MTADPFAELSIMCLSGAAWMVLLAIVTQALRASLPSRARRSHAGKDVFEYTLIAAATLAGGSVIFALFIE